MERALELTVGKERNRYAPAVGITRASRLELLAGRKFDLLVIGGGAVGASTAWAAARAGATVAVVEAGDAAGATSSASTKLLHGGLRYLATGDLKLVREAHEERRAHVEIVAPHLVRHLRFVVPVNRDSPRRPWEVRAGVTIYGGLTWFRDGRSGPLSAGAALELVPALRPDAVDAAAVYHDHQTDDARLVLAALQTAQAHGAVWINHTEVEHLRTTAGEVSGADLLDRITGERLSVEARAVVNATGPWVDTIRRLENPRAGDQRPAVEGFAPRSRHRSAVGRSRDDAARRRSRLVRDPLARDAVARHDR